MSLVAAVAAFAYLFGQLAEVKRDQYAKVTAELEPQQRKSELFKKSFTDLQKARKDLDQVTTYLDGRYYWGDVLSELRQVLIRVESGIKSTMRTDGGVWVEQLTTVTPRAPSPSESVDLAAPAAAPADTGMSEAFRRRYGLAPAAAAPAPQPDASADTTVAAPSPSKKSKGNTNELASFTITFRAISLNSVNPSANKDTSYLVLTELKSSPLFDPDPEETRFSGNIGNEEPPGTFTFGVTVRLKRPLKL